MFMGGGSNITPTPQVGNITITRNGTEITLVPPAKFDSINHTFDTIIVTDTENNLYAISKLDNAPYGGGSDMHHFFIISEDTNDIVWGSLPGSVPSDSRIDVIDAYNKSPEVLQPELIAWLEAQGFTIPIK